MSKKYIVRFKFSDGGVCNLCLDETSVENTLKNIRTLLTEYNNYNKLTQYELETFWTFYKLANAMHILQPIFISKRSSKPTTVSTILTYFFRALISATRPRFFIYSPLS